MKPRNIYEDERLVEEVYVVDAIFGLLWQGDYDEDLATWIASYIKHLVESSPNKLDFKTAIFVMNAILDYAMGYQPAKKYIRQYTPLDKEDEGETA